MVHGSWLAKIEGGHGSWFMVGEDRRRSWFMVGEDRSGVTWKVEGGYRRRDRCWGPLYTG